MAMAQDFHGVTVSGAGGGYTIVNHSPKPVMGYAIQRNTTAGPGSVSSVVDLGSWAAGKPIEPGEERPLERFNVVRVSDEGETIGYELKAVLFADGTFFGPESIFQNFSDTMSTVRSLARDVQYSENKYNILAQHKAAFSDRETILKAMRTPSVDSCLRTNMAHVILGIRDSRGEQEAEAALARLAALPDIRVEA